MHLQQQLKHGRQVDGDWRVHVLERCNDQPEGAVVREPRDVVQQVQGPGVRVIKPHPHVLDRGRAQPSLLYSLDVLLLELLEGPAPCTRNLLEVPSDAILELHPRQVLHHKHAVGAQALKWHGHANPLPPLRVRVEHRRNPSHVVGLSLEVELGQELLLDLPEGREVVLHCERAEVLDDAHVAPKVVLHTWIHDLDSNLGPIVEHGCVHLADGCGADGDVAEIAEDLTQGHPERLRHESLGVGRVSLRRGVSLQPLELSHVLRGHELVPRRDDLRSLVEVPPEVDAELDHKGRVLVVQRVVRALHLLLRLALDKLLSQPVVQIDREDLHPEHAPSPDPERRPAVIERNP
mmetsp:Transcript_3512/g.8862  ORF Transcript_3512/g.8862 Transcript_3512/m.8862 type:complete len:349 (-) Transcript_3512:96-1142(-)